MTTSWFNNLRSTGLQPMATKLFYGNKGLKKLPPLPETLKILVCDYNKLTDLPPLPQTLQSLRCSHNQLTDLPPLPKKLLQLFCYENKLTELPPLPETLQHLQCANNQLTELPPLPSALQYLTCSHNQLRELPPLPQSLLWLSCDGNPLRAFPDFPGNLLGIELDVDGLDNESFTRLRNNVDNSSAHFKETNMVLISQIEKEISLRRIRDLKNARAAMGRSSLTKEEINELDNNDSKGNRDIPNMGGPRGLDRSNASYALNPYMMGHVQEYLGKDQKSRYAENAMVLNPPPAVAAVASHACDNNSDKYGACAIMGGRIRRIRRKHYSTLRKKPKRTRRAKTVRTRKNTKK